jgi:hypothetical protein
VAGRRRKKSERTGAEESLKGAADEKMNHEAETRRRKSQTEIWSASIWCPRRSSNWVILVILTPASARETQIGLPQIVRIPRHFSKCNNWPTISPSAGQKESVGTYSLSTSSNQCTSI